MLTYADAGAQAWYADEFGITGVHLAAKRGDSPMIQALVRLGADWQATSVCGLKLLVYAALSYECMRP